MTRGLAARRIIWPRPGEPIRLSRFIRENLEPILMSMRFMLEEGGLAAHGGTVTVESSAAAGTTFTIRLPREG